MSGFRLNDVRDFVANRVEIVQSERSDFEEFKGRLVGLVAWNLIKRQSACFDNFVPPFSVNTRVFKNRPNRFQNGSVKSLGESILLRSVCVRGTKADKILLAELFEIIVHKFGTPIRMKYCGVVS